MIRFVLIFFSCLCLAACARRKTVLIDGTVQPEQVLKKLDTAAIFSYEEWRRGEAPKSYRQWNKTTLVVVRTKVAERKLQPGRYQLIKRMLDSADHGASVLFVIDGLIVSAAAQPQLRQLSPDTLSAARIMDPQAAKSLYGSEARPITLVINTRQPIRQPRLIDY